MYWGGTQLLRLTIGTATAGVPSLGILKAPALHLFREHNVHYSPFSGVPLAGRWREISLVVVSLVSYTTTGSLLLLFPTTGNVHPFSTTLASANSLT